MITLYGCGSPNVLKVVIALEELELAYRMEAVDVFHGEQFTDAFGALNPNRKVPVLVDSDGPGGESLTVWESGAILIYLAEKSGKLLPDDPRRRITTLQWLMFQMASVGPMFGQLAHFTIYAPQPEHSYSRDRYATEAKRLYDVLEQRLSEVPFLGGQAYSIADIAAWPWARDAGRRGADLAVLPATKRWIEEVGARPGVRRAVEAHAPLTRTDYAGLVRDEPDAIDRFVQRGRFSRPL